MDDLKARLRDYRVKEKPLRNEAADRIEKLEAALDEVRNWVWGKDRREQIDAVLSRATLSDSSAK